MSSFSLFHRPVKLKVARTNVDAILPKKNHSNKFADAAYDLFPFELSDTVVPVKDESGVVTGERALPWAVITLNPGERKLIGTGIRLAIPDGYWVKFHERSGMANKGIHVLGGVIDSGYTGELKVILYNSNTDAYLHDCEKAIAQFTVEKVTESCLELISEDDFVYETIFRERKDKGFGSSDGK